MGETTIKIKQCDRCGCTRDNGILYNCKCCGREVCYSCEMRIFPFDKLWIYVCDDCAKRKDFKDLKENVEKRWRRFQGKIQREFEALPVIHQETWQEKSERLNKQLK